MANLPAIKRITREDLKDAPSWIDRLIYPINLFMDSVYRAMSGQITFVDNITAQKYSFQITAGALATDNTMTFSPTLNKRPEFLLATVIEKNTNYVPIGSAVYLDWNYDGTYINITSITGLTNTKTYEVKLLVI